MSYTKKYLYKKQYSNDGGQTWEDVTPLEITTSGDSIGYFDTLDECQSTPYGLKFYATFDNNPPRYVECNGNPELNRYDTSGYNENITSVIIGDCVLKISNSCFSNNESILSSVTMSDSVIKIGDTAFLNCGRIVNLTISKNITYIGAEAFLNCIGLTSFEIPSGVTYIGYGAFGDCSGLTSIDIPSGVTSIGDSAFRNCSGLTSITVNATTPPTLGGYNVFDNTNNCQILVPCESIDTYKTASKWSNLASRIQPINGSCTSYSGQYLTFRAEENSMFRFSQPSKYSLDSGTTWTSLASNTWTPTVASGDTIMWKTTTSQSNSAGTFSSSGMFIAEGNPLSLVFEDNFDGQTSLANGYLYALSNLFSGCTNLTSAENLSLPATALANSCYDSMFKGCVSLTKAPSLPATTLETACYQSMFSGCTSLTSAPELQATALYNGCYAYMFADCTSLTAAPNLPATALDNSCYTGMFEGCTSLTTVQSVLPATTMKYSCYNAMFEGCTSLTTAPELPATILAEQCYSIMFAYCTNLNYVKCNATDISANVCTTNWLINVASSGTFVKNPSMSSWTNGNSGIPNGWTVIDAS